MVGKVHFVQAGVSELRIPDFQFKKRSPIQYAIIKRNGHEKATCISESQSRQITVFELNIPKWRPGQFGPVNVATLEFALVECFRREVRL